MTGRHTGAGPSGPADAVRSRAVRDARILDVVRALREGEVTTYGDVADTAGHPGLGRHVGHLLAASGDGTAVAGDDELPWWRVVAASGRLVPGLEAEQAALLRAEGVVVRDARVRSAPLGRFGR